MFDYDKLVGSIYDCAANPELWPETLGYVRDTVGGAYALVGFIDTSEIAFGKKPGPLLVRTRAFRKINGTTSLERESDQRGW